MSAKLFLANKKTVKLCKGTYCGDDKCLKKERIIKICLGPQSGISISVKGVVQYSYDNTSLSKYCAEVDIKLRKCYSITVSIACGNKLPCPDTQWDYIIVGEGTAGAILARYLSNDLKTRVLAIEIGVDHQGNPVTEDPNWIPIANTLLYNPEYAINYPISLAPLLSQSYSEGVGRGGGSAHNFLEAVIPTPNILAQWATLSGNNSWTYNNISPLIKILETYTPDGTSPNYAVRGQTGFINVTQNPPVNIGNNILNGYNTVTKVPYIPDYNDYTQGPVGISAIQQFITPGANSIRSYADQVLLTDGVIVDANGNGLNGRKLKIVTNARVTNVVLTAEGKATSVKYLYSNNGNFAGEACLSKHGRVIMSAGSINSPKILLASGVGPAADLQALGIPVIVDSPNVGNNLQDQYGTNFLMTGSVPNLSQIFYDPLGTTTRTVQLTALSVSAIQQTALSVGAVSLFVPALLDPTSLGKISLVNTNPQTPPLVNIGFYQTPNDIALGVANFIVAKQVAIAAGEDLIFPPPQDFPAPYGPAPDNTALVADLTDPRYFVLQSHIVGTCRMAQSITNGVVDGTLKVFGLQNVYVCDNSIQPISSDGNTCYPAYLIALNFLRQMGIPLN